MSDLKVTDLVDEVVSALDTVGELENWMLRRLDGSVAGPLMDETYRQMTGRLLEADPPEIARWEHFLVSAAVNSAKCKNRIGYVACKHALDKLIEIIQEDSLSGAEPKLLVTLAGALTLILAAQRKLRQSVELSTSLLCEQFPDLLPEIAELCQGIWQRRGQMSGSDGLFVWDTRNNEWRLSLDFKPYRPQDSPCLEEPPAADESPVT
jgi:hypothetical protein